MGEGGGDGRGGWGGGAAEVVRCRGGGEEGVVRGGLDEERWVGPGAARGGWCCDAGGGRWYCWYGA